MKKAHSTGFTLMELMLALLIGGILIGLIAPNVRSFARNNQLSGGVNDLLRSFQIARNESIKRQLPTPQSIIVCASADPTNANPTCDYAGTPFQGWITFQDTNGDWQFSAGDQIIEQHALLDTTMSVRTDNDSIVSYALTGFANATGPAPANNLAGTSAVVMCDDRGDTPVGADSTARAILVDQTGRPQVTRSHATIAATIAFKPAELTCP